MASPKRSSRIEANNFAVGMIEWYCRKWYQEKGWAEEKQSPPSSKAQSLSRASHKGKGPTTANA